MINYAEICVANLTGVLLMFFLINTRKVNKEDRRIGEWIFDAIRRVGKVLANSIADNCIALRFAGDEFIVLVQTDSREEVDELIKRIKSNADKINQSAGKVYKLEFSLGVSCLSNESNDIEAFVKEMDHNMYIEKEKNHAKEGGLCE